MVSAEILFVSILPVICRGRLAPRNTLSICMLVTPLAQGVLSVTTLVIWHDVHINTGILQHMSLRSKEKRFITFISKSC